MITIDRSESWQRSLLFIFQTTVVSSSTAPDAENMLSDEEINHQEVFIKEQDFLHRYEESTPSTSETALLLRGNETLMSQDQWNLPQESSLTCPEDSLQSKELLLHCSSSPAMTAAICLMVEDPYFDTVMSSPSSEDAPKDSPLEWRGSSDFKIPSVLVNDQDLELNAATSGK